MQGRLSGLAALARRGVSTAYGKGGNGRYGRAIKYERGSKMK